MLHSVASCIDLLHVFGILIGISHYLSNNWYAQMARMTTPLRDSQIKTAKVEEGKTERVLYDGDGLQIHLKSNGSKLWNFRYKHPVTKQRRIMAFGAYPALSIANARELRQEALALLAIDLDPKLEKERKRRQQARDHSNTFLKVAEEFMNSIKRKKVSEDHANDIWRSLELHVFPFLGNKPISQLEAIDFIDALTPMETRGTLEQLKRMCQRVNEILDFATNKGYIKHNPASKISQTFSPPETQNLPTIPPSELPRLMKTLAFASIQRQTRLLLEWQLHTMARPNEAARVEWAHIDFGIKVWKVPKEQMKMRNDFAVPLTSSTENILKIMKGISGGRRYVFPKRGDPKGHMSSQTVNSALKRMGFHGELVSHGMRSIASTLLNENAANEKSAVIELRKELIELSLAHKEYDTVRHVYNYAEFIEARRKLLSEWSEFILESAKGYGTISNLID